MLALGVPGLQALPSTHIQMKMLPTKLLMKAREMKARETKKKVMKVKVENLVLKMKALATKLASLSARAIPMASAWLCSAPND